MDVWSNRGNRTMKNSRKKDHSRFLNSIRISLMEITFLVSRFALLLASRSTQIVLKMMNMICMRYCHKYILNLYNITLYELTWNLLASYYLVINWLVNPEPRYLVIKICFSIRKLPVFVTSFMNDHFLTNSSTIVILSIKFISNHFRFQHYIHFRPFYASIISFLARNPAKHFITIFETILILLWE